MRALISFYCFVFFIQGVAAGPLVLVEPDQPALQGDHSYTARTTLRRYARWLDELGLTYRRLPMANLNNAGLKHAQVVILPYNPSLDRSDVQALERYIRKGGKILVFESASSWLADLMGVELASRTSSSDYGQWHQILWKSQEHAVLPQEIYQHSWNINLARARPGGSWTAASWVDQRGRLRPEAAALKTAHGYWFNQVLLDGDSGSKKRLLLSLIGEYYPDAWREAAMALRLSAPRIEPYTNLRETMRGLRPKSPQERNAAKRTALINHAQQLSNQISKDLKAQEYKTAVSRLLLMQHQLQKALALSQRPVANEMVGVWDQNGAGLYTGNWPLTASVLAQHGVTAIFPNMLWPGKAHLTSQHLPASKTFKLYGDQLRQAVKACHDQGIEVHVWKVCWKASNAPSDFRAQLKREGRLQVNANGQAIPWLCPSHPKNIRHEIDALVETARNYDVDGIHLDYIRYPDRHACYSATTRKAFERWHGQSIPNWPKPVLHKARLSSEFERFRAEQITSFVRQLREELNAVRKVQLSAAVFGKYPSCVNSVGQDYRVWMQDGLVDFITPMNYTDDPKEFEAWLKVQNNLPRAWGKVVPGIGAIANESELLPDQIIAQVNTARKNGNRGYVLFKLDSSLEHRVLPLLSTGISKPK